MLTANLALTAISCLYCSTHHNVIRNMAGPKRPAAYGVVCRHGPRRFFSCLLLDGLRSSNALHALRPCRECLVGVAAPAFKARSVLLALAQTGTATAAPTAWTLPTKSEVRPGVREHAVRGLMVLWASAVMGTMMMSPKQSCWSTVGALLFSTIVHGRIDRGRQEARLDTGDACRRDVVVHASNVPSLSEVVWELQDDCAFVPR